MFVNNSSGPSAKGVTLTGSGKFIGNGANGLSVNSKGSVSLTGVIAGSNSIGINVYANGTMTLTCSDAADNGTGLIVRPLNAAEPLKVALKGFLNYGNTTNEDIVADPILRTACPTG